MKRRSYYATFSDKPSVEVCKAQKRLLVVIRYRPLSHSINVSRVHLYLTRGYDGAKERHRFSMEFALFCFNIKLADMANMGILVRGKKSG